MLPKFSRINIPTMNGQFFLLVLLTVHCAVALPRWNDDDVNNRIVGGQTAEPNQFPYQVSLRGKAANNHFCGGSIIRVNWILSAAHCLINTDPDAFIIVAGAHYRTERTSVYDAVEVIIHENYTAYNLRNDISVARTAIDIVFSPTVQPISIGDGSYVGAGLIGRASGWGNLMVFHLQSEYSI